MIDKKHYEELLESQRNFVDRELLVQALLEKYFTLHDEMFTMYFSKDLKNKLEWTSVDQDPEHVWEIFEDFAELVQDNKIRVKNSALFSTFDVIANKRQAVSVEFAIQTVEQFPTYKEI